MNYKQETKQAELCPVTIIHRDSVQKTQKVLPSKNLSMELAGLFKIFGDSTRITIMWALQVSELCVCDLCAVLSMEQSAISHQLSILKQSRLVKQRRAGKVVYYSLADNHVHSIINQALEHVSEPKVNIMEQT
jgi:ArsR family transcriptional regulator